MASFKDLLKATETSVSWGKGSDKLQKVGLYKATVISCIVTEEEVSRLIMELQTKDGKVTVREAITVKGKDGREVNVRTAGFLLNVLRTVQGDNALDHNDLFAALTQGEPITVKEKEVETLTMPSIVGQEVGIATFLEVSKAVVKDETVVLRQVKVDMYNVFDPETNKTPFETESAEAYKTVLQKILHSVKINNKSKDDEDAQQDLKIIEGYMKANQCDVNIANLNTRGGTVVAATPAQPEVEIKENAPSNKDENPFG